MTTLRASLRFASVLLAALLLSLFTACADQVSAPDGETSELGADVESSQSEVSDAVHGGEEHFYFLPPLVGDPEPTGVFDASFLEYLRVEICQWEGSECGASPIAVFTADGQPASRRIRLDEKDEHYIANWNTASFNVTPEQVYRVRVLVRDVEFGHLDLTMTERKSSQAGRRDVVIGSTVVIKFRVEQGIKGAVLVGTSGGSVTSQDGRLELNVPSSALAGPALITVAQTTSVPTGPIMIGPAYEVEPHGLRFENPASLSISYVDQEIPQDVTEGDVQLLVSDGDQWRRADLIHGGSINLIDNVLTTERFRLSNFAAGAPQPGIVEIALPWHGEDEFWVPRTYPEHASAVVKGEDATWDNAVDFFFANHQAPNTFEITKFGSAGREVTAPHSGTVHVFSPDPVQCSASWLADLGLEKLRYWMIEVDGGEVRTQFIHVRPKFELDGREVSAGKVIGIVADPRDPSDQLDESGISSAGCTSSAHMMMYVIKGAAKNLDDDPDVEVRMGGEVAFAGPSHQIDPPERPDDMAFGAMPRTVALSEWQTTSLPDFDARVSDVAVNADDELFVTLSTGNRTTITTGPGVWKSSDNGQSWESLNCGLSGISTNVTQIAIAPDGDMFVTPHGKGVFKFNFGTDCWERLGNSPQMLTELVATDDAVYAGDGFFCRGLHRSTDDGVTWVELGGPHCVNAVAVNTDKNIVYLGEGGNGGIWKSTDGGFSFVEKRCCLGLRDIVIDPDEDVFLATNGGASGPGSGVLRSTDDGETWNEVNTGLDPTEIEVVSANAAGDIFAGARGGDGVWLSTSNGDSWTSFSEGLEGSIGAIEFQSTGHGVAGGETVWRTTESTER